MAKKQTQSGDSGQPEPDDSRANQEQSNEQGSEQNTNQPPVEQVISSEADEQKLLSGTTESSQNVEVTVTPTTKVENILSDEELLSQSNPSTDFSPFANQRIERAYVDADSNAKVVDRVPEKEFKKITTGATTTGLPGSESAPAGAAAAGTTAPAVDPETAKKEAEMLANALIGAYRQANDLGAWIVKVDPSKLIEWSLDDKIDLEMQLPMPDNTKVIPAVFFQSFNDAVDESKEIPDNHFDEVRQSMIREFVKRGIGISDMANIIQFFTRDILMRSGNFYNLYRQRVINTKQLFGLYEQQKKIIEQLNIQNAGKVTTPQP